MRSKRRKTLLSVCSALVLLTVAGATGLTLHRAQADTTATATPTFEMNYGASIRVSDPTGIRFGAKLGTEYYEELSADNSDAQLHVAVIPYAMYNAYQADTTKGTTAVYPWLVSQYGTAGFVDLEIPTENFYSVTENGNTYYYAKAVLSNVYFNNYHLEFVGVAYLQRGTAGSYTYQDVTNVNEEDNARSIFEVACKASSDEEEYAKYKDFLDETTEKGMYRAYGVSCEETIDSEGIKTAESYTYDGTIYATYEEMKAGVGITVSESTVTIEGETIEVTGGTSTQLNATVAFSDGKEFTKNAYYTWSSSDEEIVSVDKNGVMTAKGLGSATITVSAIGGRFTDTCTVNVTQGGTVNLDYEFLAKGDAGVTSTDTGNATIDLTEMGIVGTNVTEVLCNGTAVTIAEKTATSITLMDAPAGDQEYTFKTTVADYIVNGCVYGYGISTKEELIDWRTTYASAANYKAYTVLLDDIDLEGAVLDDVASYFYATFDGRGHTISNFTYGKGFIWLVNPAVVKNVQFTGATQDCTFAGTGAASIGFFGSYIRGTVENVKLETTTANMASGAEHRAILAANVANGNSAYPTYLTNVVVAITPQSGSYHYVAMKANACGTWDNVYAYYAVTNTKGGALCATNNATITNSAFYATQAAMLAEVDFSTWAEPWQVDFAGAPYIGEPIERGTIAIAGEFLAQGDAGTAVTNTGNATFDLSSTGYDFSGTARVLCDGEAVTVAGSTATTVTVTDAPAGEHVYTIATPAADYVINGFVYGQGISTKDEFIAWQSAVAAGTGKCYTVLLNDIDLEGATLTDPTSNYYGTFDGRGYTVSDFTYTKGVVQLQSTGVVKNVQFTEAVQDCTAIGSTAITVGFFGGNILGTVENVKICTTTKNITAGVDHRGVLSWLVNGWSTTDDGIGHVKNVVIEATPQAGITHYVNQQIGGSAVLENVYMYFTTTEATGKLYMSDKSGLITVKNSGFYASQAAMLAEVDFSTWAEPWKVDVNGVPYIDEVQAGASDVGKVRVTLDGVMDAPTPSGNVAVDFTDKIADIGTVSSVLCGTLNVEYTVNGNVLTLQNVPAGEKVYTIETSSNIYLVTLNVYEVEKTVVTVEGVFYAQGDGGIAQNATTGNATLDFSGSEVTLGNVQSVTYGDGTAATYSASGNALTLTNAPAGDETYTIITDTHIYTVSICVYNTGISTVDEFLAYRNATDYSYAVLLNDIDFGGATLDTTMSEALRGTFDGRGHTLSNFTTTTGLFGSIYQGTGAVKNLRIDATQNCADIVTTTDTYSAVRYGFLTQTSNGLIENVYIRGTLINIPEGVSHWGVVVYNTGANAVIRNVVAVIESNGAEKHMAVNTWNGTVDNVYLVYDGTGVVTDYGSATNTGIYADEPALAAAVDFSTWPAPWKTVNGIPYIGEPVAEEKQTITVEGEFLAQGDAGTEKANTGNATIDFTDTVVNLSNVQSVTYGEEKTAVSYSVSGNALTLTDAPAGDETYTIVTSGDTYIVNACIYGHGISTKEEFIAWRDATGDGNSKFWAYTVLLNDIDLEGAELAAVSGWMRGWLDGRGHTVANFTLKDSLVVSVYVDGGFKNIQFINATQDCTNIVTTSVNAVRNGFLAQTCNGTIENVLIKGELINLPESIAHWGLICYNGTPVIKNVIVDVKSSGTAKQMAANISAGTLDNVYMILNDEMLVSKSAVTDYTGATNSGVYATESKLLETVDFSSWSDPWIVDGSSLPYMSNYSEYLGFIHDTYVGTTSYKLVENGTTEYKVLMNSDTYSEIWTTFTDFQTYFAEATGVTLSWAQDKYASNYNDSAKFISLGKTAALEQSGIAVDYDLLGKQGYQIVTLGDDIYVCGENEGLSNAIYDLLNRLVGLEVYTTTRYAINTVTDLALPDLSIREVPDIEYRLAVNGELAQYETNATATRRAMRIHNMGDIIVGGGKAHNMTTSIVPYETNSSKTNWFYNSGAQLCYTAHGNATDYEEMVAEAVANIKELLLADTKANLLSLTQMDVKTWCNCTACSALNTKYCTDAASQIIFVNDVTDIVNAWLVSEQGGREVQFAIFAYYTTKTAPATQNADGTWTAIDETVVLNDNVSVWIAPIEDDFRININDTSDTNTNNMRTMIESWSACASSYFIWSYDAYFHNYMIPYDTYDAMQDMVRFCAEYNTKFFYAQGPHDLTQNTAFGDLKGYLYSKLMWNSSLDVNTLIDNFFNDVYKEAASSMKSVFEAWRTKSATFGGNIYSTSNSWLEIISNFDNDWLNTQLGLLETAIDQIAAYETSDSELYTAIYDSIVAESISLRYLYKQRNSSEYSSTAWGALADDATRLGVNMVSEGTAF